MNEAADFEYIPTLRIIACNIATIAQPIVNILNEAALMRRVMNLGGCQYHHRIVLNVRKKIEARGHQILCSYVREANANP